MYTVNNYCKQPFTECNGWTKFLFHYCNKEDENTAIMASLSRKSINTFERH